MTMIKTGWTKVKGLWSNESGQGLVEYALILALVSICVIVALTALNGSINKVFNDIVAKLNARPT